MITENAYAKINLKLAITGKRQDGYHAVDMLMQTVALHDKVTLLKTVDYGIWIESNFPELDNPSNLAYRAAKLLAERYNIRPQLKIVIEKNIFIAAGLAGGSSDAAAVLRGCNRLWDLRLSNHDLEKIGAELGSDIPFLIEGGTARATGRGEILTPLHSAETCWVVLAKPKNIDISTKWAYTEFDKVPKDKLADAPQNNLELVVFEKYPVLQEMKINAIEKGAELAMMSGSGPTLFALCKNTDKAAVIAEALKQYDTQVVVTKFMERTK
ncbi:MAG: 4-(cytidine 5'-diphospho)-2-C-methyl-D-erythritol kinase [Phascolarctobacterium sp.]|nr:4-(cytidine 5'-diphospho)-2-C-methyl-D-erythritol kinase [Candidatus Phascolarctobacterium caballi]